MDIVLSLARRTVTLAMWVVVIFVSLLISATALYPMARGYVGVTVLTGSMSAGGIHPGDLIFVEEIEDISEVKIGDVVTFMPNPDDTTTMITHRITDIAYSSAGTIVTTKGDSNSAPDVPLPAAAVRAKLADLSIGPWSTPFVIPKIGEPYVALAKFKTESGIQDAVPAIGWGLIGAGTLYFLAGGLLSKARAKRRDALDDDHAGNPPRIDELNADLAAGLPEQLAAVKATPEQQ